MSSGEDKRKHLEFIQLTITRMNVNSFVVKGWLMTLVAAIFVLSEKDANTKFLWFAPFASLLFWMLDAFFIHTERKFRGLYDHVRKLPETEIDYSMNISSFEKGTGAFFGALFSRTLWLFYPFVILASAAASYFMN